VSQALTEEQYLRIHQSLPVPEVLVVLADQAHRDPSTPLPPLPTLQLARLLLLLWSWRRSSGSVDCEAAGSGRLTDQFVRRSGQL
jgi:hypothetical protein